MDGLQLTTMVCSPAKDSKEEAADAPCNGQNGGQHYVVHGINMYREHEDCTTKDEDDVSSDEDSADVGLLSKHR